MVDVFQKYALQNDEREKERGSLYCSLQTGGPYPIYKLFTELKRIIFSTKIQSRKNLHLEQKILEILFYYYLFQGRYFLQYLTVMSVLYLKKKSYIVWAGKINDIFLSY